MSDWFEPVSDKKTIAREREKARELRASTWWKNLLARGVCHYCGGKFPPEELTMDHIVPVARGGKSTRGNVVPCCKECNNRKKYLTPAEMILNGDDAAADGGQNSAD
ncbi:MAG: HNH endonuclease [Victivallaceae bacterium]|nr:HNH endonuclease [Victivallaceae bacterium]